MPEVRVQEAITSIQKIKHPKSPRILRVFRLYAASYFGETQECDLVQIVFDDGLVNYGQAQIIRNQAFNINAQGIIAPGFVDIRSYDGFTEFFQLIV